MSLNTEHLMTTLNALESALVLYHDSVARHDATQRDVFRMAIIKGFELTQEVSFKLLKRRLKDFGYSAGRVGVEATPVKELLRMAAQHGLVTLEEVERWFAYRDNRNNTAHDYGEAFVQETLALVPSLIRDARALERQLKEG